MIRPGFGIRHSVAPVCGMLALLAAGQSGCHCVTKASHAVPAARLPAHMFGVTKDGLAPILFTALGQEKPAAHLVGAGDNLAVYIYGVLPPGADETPVLQQFQTLNQRYYPPHGAVVAPTTGLPMTVTPRGTLDMPLVGEIDVAGLTVQEVADKLRRTYREQELIPENNERVNVSLVSARVKRIVVMRQDTPSQPVALTPPGVVDQIHRGSADVVDLPAYENDVLHALAITGGLPGTDAASEVWVMRNMAYQMHTTLSHDQLQAMASEHVIDGCGPKVIRIPLVAYPGEPLPFGPHDVVLNDGDVVYVPRRNEYFYTGGLIEGAKIPLPAEEDLDVLEAITLATSSVGGPLGRGGVALAPGRPGHMVRPSRVLILRKLPDGKQMAIRVDLARAIEDEKERIVIQPGDIVMLNHKPHEALINGVLNIFNINLLLNPTEL